MSNELKYNKNERKKNDIENTFLESIHTYRNYGRKKVCGTKKRNFDHYQIIYTHFLDLSISQSCLKNSKIKELNFTHDPLLCLFLSY